MKAIEASVVSLYEGGATIAQICESEGLERAVVVTILSAHIPDFADAPAPNPTDDIDKHISDGELNTMFEAYKTLQYDENPVVREKVLRNCINLKMKVSDGLGKDDPKKLAKLMAKEIGKHANIMLLNDMLKKARETKQAQVIDVENVSPPQLEAVNA